MLPSTEKITQIRGETSTAFIKTLSTIGMETRTKVHANQEKCDETTSLSVHVLKQDVNADETV